MSLSALFPTRDTGRDPAKIRDWAQAEAAHGWQRLGTDIVMLYPMYRMPELDRQIETLRRFKEVAPT
jgi:hypothetical protein